MLPLALWGVIRGNAFAGHLRYPEEAVARATCGVALPARFPREMAPQPVAAPRCPPSPRTPAPQTPDGASRCPRLRGGRDPGSTASWRSVLARVQVWKPDAGLGARPRGSRGAQDMRRAPCTCAPSTWARRDDPGGIYWAMAAPGASVRAVRQASAGDW